MHSQFFSQDHLEYTRLLMPVAGVVHVGAGAGRSVSYVTDWEVPVAVFIEADESLHKPLSRIVEGHSGWSAHTALVSDREGETDFCIADNPSESGLIPPESLTTLWKNLKTKERRRMNATTLASLLGSLRHPPQSINWAVIECLPALPILRGSGPCLEHWDVILARVVLDASRLPGLAATKSELDAFLSTHGFRCIASQEERQPAVGSTLYVRDHKAFLGLRIAELQRFCETQAKLAEERQRQIDQLTWERDSQAKVAADRQAQIEQLNKARDHQAKLAEQRQQQIDQLTWERDSQAKLVADRQAQIEQLNKARDDQAKLAEQRQQLIDQLTKERDSQAKLVADRQAQIEQLNKARDDQAKLAEQRQQFIDQLTERDSEAKVAADRQAQIEQLNKARDDQAKLAEQRQQLIDQLTKERDSQAKVAADRQAQIEQLNKARDDQAKLAEQRQQLIDQLTKERDSQAKVAADRQAQIEQLNKARDDQAGLSRQRLGEIEKLVSEREQQTKRIAQLESERTELDYRQHLLDEELLKAEAQIELIKDVLLREKAI